MRTSAVGVCHSDLHIIDGTIPIQPPMVLGHEPAGVVEEVGSEVRAFAERMIVHENGLVKIREDMPLDRAALIGCGVTTGLGAALNTAKIRPGQTAAVIRCGGVGPSIIQGCRMAGAL